MKVNLTNLLRKEEPNNWSEEDFKRYLKDSLIEIIRLELESLPRQEWEKTIKTWSKICSFADSLRQKEEKERQELYKRFNFDSVMVHITESVIEKLNIAHSTGLLGRDDKPEKIIRLGLEVAEDSEEVNFIKRFFKA